MLRFGLLQLGGVVLTVAARDGNWRCCWGIASCDSWSEASCAPVAGCTTQATCTAAGCDRGRNATYSGTEGMWCRTEPCDTKGENCASSVFDDNLRLPVRPPRQTPDQARAMQEIQRRAVHESAAARQWVVSYFGSVKFRQNLDASLQHYSNEELLEMFTWEFQRLPLIHNTPIDDWDVDRIGIGDDSPLNVTLDNGNLQQPCQRYVLGGPESLFSTIMYASMYVSDFFLHAAKLCDLTSTLRESNNCMMYNANNLRKTSIGNTNQFGAITYVLNEQALAGRSFWEPVDGGMYDFFQYIPPFLFRPYPAQGTIYPPAFYHLLKPHEDVFDLGGGYKTIATVFNSWWVPGAPMATGAVAGTSMMDGNPYFEVMVNGNALIPEDLTSVIAKFASNPEVSDGSSSGPGAPGLWGTPLGAKLRAWMIANQRPLIWSDGLATPMLLDPHVAAAIPGFSQRGQITDADIIAFETVWKQGRPPSSSLNQKYANETMFGRLATRASPYLHFEWRSWTKKSACEEQEQVAGSVIMGTDGNGKCVFNARVPSANPSRWECLNDGTCALSSDESRALFVSAAECLASCATSFECVRVNGASQTQTREPASVPIPSAPRSPAPAYCLPRLPLGRNTSNRVHLARAATVDPTVYSSVSACEAACVVDDPDRNLLCMDWVLIVKTVLVVYFASHTLGYCIVIPCVARRQKFSRQLTRCFCCSKIMVPRICCFCVPRPSCMCCWMTFCPCFQCFRVLGFLYGKCCGWCGCICFTLCCLSNPVGILFSLVFNGLCGCSISACTRYQLRKRLGIAGTIWEDISIHLCATSCARCQESLELSSAGYTGCMYERSPSVDDDALGSLAARGDVARQEPPVMPIPPTSPAPESHRQALTTPLLHSGDEVPLCRVEPHSAVQDITTVGTVSSTWTVDDHRAAVAKHNGRVGPHGIN